MGAFCNKHFRIFFLFFLFCCQFNYAQHETFFSGISDSILALYRNDADRLALRVAISGKSTYKDSVKIDKRLSQYYLKALLAIYNSKDLPARDTVVRYLNIHSYNPGMNSIVVRGVASLVWMNNLRTNRYPTGNPTLDFLMRKYELEKSFYSNLFQPNLVVLRSGNNYNLEALSCSLESVYGARGIQPEFLYGDGSDITDSLVQKELVITYSYGWDNCRTNCRSKRYWKFKVKEDFSVEYLGSFGQTLEPGLEIGLQSGIDNFKGLRLYPNPVLDKLYLDVGSLNLSELKLSVVNLKGEIVFTRTSLGAGQLIDLGHLLSGNYLLNLESGGKKRVYTLKKNNNPRGEN